MRKKFFITGGSGLLALKWALSQQDKVDIVLCLHHRVINLDRVKTVLCSLNSINNIVNCLQQERPDVVIHAAGLTDINKCEKKPKLAEYVNVTITRNVAVACALEGVRLVYISTDQLFDGSQSLYLESDIASPINIYGATKVKAEGEVSKQDKRSLIIRTNFYGWGTTYRQSFSDFILKSLKNKREIKLFDDVYYTPILVHSLSVIIHDLINIDASGIFNIVGDDKISKFKFGQKLAREFNLDLGLIQASKLMSDSSLVQRPNNMALSNCKVKKILGKRVISIDNDIKILYQQSKTKLFQGSGVIEVL